MEPKLKYGYKKHTVYYFFFYVHKIKNNIKDSLNKILN